jgi:hypothetical protein
MTTVTPPTPPENMPTATTTLTTALLPNPTNDIMFAGLFGLSDAEKKKFKRTQERALRKVKHGIQIEEENKKLLWEHRDKGIILTAPERKPGVVFEDNFRPGVELGDYVSVEADSSPGNNRPAGCGFVTSVNGVGAATLASVRYSPRVYDNGREHKKIPFQSMTQVVYGREFDIPSRNRVTTAPKMLDPSPPKTPRKGDTRIPIERLLDDLKYGKSHHRSKGWRRKDKSMYKGANDPSFKGPIPALMTSEEQQELYTESEDREIRSITQRSVN